jgi:uncharacterized protein (DUF433 family)
MRLEEAVSRDPLTMSGALCFRGTRVPVSTLFDHLEVGELEEFYSGFPSVTPEMVQAVLDASRELIDEAVMSKAA